MGGNSQVGLLQAEQSLVSEMLLTALENDEQPTPAKAKTNAKDGDSVTSRSTSSGGTVTQLISALSEINGKLEEAESKAQSPSDVSTPLADDVLENILSNGTEIPPALLAPLDADRKSGIIA